MLNTVENHYRFIKFYFTLIIVLFIVAMFVFLVMVLNDNETILLKEIQIAGKNGIISTKGLVQQEIPIVDLTAKKKENTILNTINEEKVLKVSEEIETELKTTENLEEETLIKIENNEEIIEEKTIQESQNEISEKSIHLNQENTENKEAEKNNIECIYEGFKTIGKIEIPETEVDMPILSNVTVNGMEKAPCLLDKTGELNQSGNNLIVGHNYRNNTLFSNNGKLKIGDKIYITSLDGVKLEYTIYEKFITTSEDVDYIKREIGDKPEITLSCCADNDIDRIVILAKANN